MSKLTQVRIQEEPFMATTFLDGPAQGVTLRLARAPMVLRVVQASDGEIDALDMRDDTPRPHERVYLYILAKAPGGVCFWDGRDKAGRRVGGRCQAGVYRLCSMQPPEATSRERESFEAWVHGNIEALTSEYRRGTGEPADA